MTKIDIFSGFLGAGKTTLMQKLMKEAYQNEKLVLIENEFGEIGIDGGFLKESGVQITEMNSGCICCSLVGDFGKALGEVMETYHPDRILIEPSGVGKLSDVMHAVENVPGAEIHTATAVADASKVRLYMKNFGEFYNNQIESANCIVLSRTQNLSEEKLQKAVAMIREKNQRATIITTPWDELDGTKILEAMEQQGSLEHFVEETEHEHHHEHHHEHDEDCTCGCHDHEHHHEHHHDHEHCHEHHEHDEHCSCGCHDHHHHHADEVFSSIGRETARKYTKAELTQALEALENENYGQVLRAKGIVDGTEGWIYFDYVPGEINVRDGAADIIGKICVIGSELKEAEILKLFWVEE